MGVSRGAHWAGCKGLINCASPHVRAFRATSQPIPSPQSLFSPSFSEVIISSLF